MNREAWKSLFASKKILVLGDVMLDKYMVGTVSRISPEAPVPIVNLSFEDTRLGGAANVAKNLVSLGAKTFVCSVIGTDTDSQLLNNLLINDSINANALVRSETRKTTVKTRIIGNNQQLVRIDSEQTNYITDSEETALIHQVEALMQEGLDAVIFEDYNKGILTERVISEVIALCKKYKVLSTVDPKKDNFLAYKEVDLFKPNFKELKEGLHRDFSVTDEGAFNEAIAELERVVAPRISFVTLSEHGVFIKEGAQAFRIPAHMRNIADVSGAGDSVISVATLCLAAGFSIDKIAAYANLAGGLVCEKTGVVCIDMDEWLDEIELVEADGN
jgi:rfaE bifunctional protein kinase chain/domain